MVDEDEDNVVDDDGVSYEEGGDSGNDNSDQWDYERLLALGEILGGKFTVMINVWYCAVFEYLLL